MPADVIPSPSLDADPLQPIAPSDVPDPLSSIEPAQGAPALDPLSASDLAPPRIDAGEDVDDVLTEVTKMFGARGRQSSQRDAEELGEQFGDLAATEPISPQEAGPEPQETEPEPASSEHVPESVPNEELEPEAASLEHLFQKPADPFRDETATPVGKAVEVLQERPAENLAAKPDAAPSVPLWRKLLTRLRLPKSPKLSLSKRLLVPVVAVLVAAIGGVAGFSLLGSRSQTANPQPQTEEVQPAEHEVSAEVNVLEEQLKQALAERDAALKERADALKQLKKLADEAHATHQSAEEIERAKSVRAKAEQELARATHLLRASQLRTYNVQLARVRDVWRSNPGLAVALLEDTERCPTALRDFTWGYFYGRAKSDHGGPLGHTGPVTAVLWSPDGKQLVSSGEDGLVKFWSPIGSKELGSLLAHAGGTNAIAFSRESAQLVSAGADGTVKLWNVATRKIVATFFGHVGNVGAATISPDGSLIVSGGDDGTVKFWDVVSRRARATRWSYPRSAEPSDADDPSRFVHSLAVSADGRWVASGGYRVVRLWDAQSAEERTTFAVPEGPVTALAFSADGQTIVAGSEGVVYRWNVESLAPSGDPLTVNGTVRALAFSPDRQTLAIATPEAAVLMPEPDEPHPMTRRITKESAAWDPLKLELPRLDQALNRGFIVPRHAVRLRGHREAVTGVAFSPDGQTVATSGMDGAVKLWDPNNGSVEKLEPDRVLTENPGSVSVAYSGDGRQFAAAGSDSITLWSAPEGVEIAQLRGRVGGITKIDFAPGGGLLASSSRDWPVLIWDLGSARVRTALNGHSAGVNSVRYALDGKLLISGSDDGSVRLWDAETGREAAVFRGHSGIVRSAVIAPGGKVAASAGDDASIKLWDLKKKKELATLTGHAGPVGSLAFTPDGQFLLSVERSSVAPIAPVDGRGPLRLWRVPTGTLVHTWGRAGTIRDAAFSPDGKTLATADQDAVTLWDAESGELRETLRFPEAGAVLSVTFARDGLTLAAGAEKALLFWKAAPYAAALSGNDKLR